MWMKWVQELYINSTWHHINAAQHIMYIVHASFMVGWLGFNGILSTQVAAISCLKKFKVC